MTESNRQQRNAQPRRPGAGSVPVLFALQNVQPNIVGGIANATKATAVTPSAIAAMSLATSEAPAVPTSTARITPAAKSVSKTETASSNRSYNVVVGVLVIALCLLIIRNTQSSKNGDKGTIASNSSSSQSSLKTEGSSSTTPPPIASPGSTNSASGLAKADLVPSLATPQLASHQVATNQLATNQVVAQPMTDAKRPELSRSEPALQASAMNSVASIDLNASSSSSDASPDPISLQAASVDNASHSRGALEQNMVQAKPSLLPPSGASGAISAPNPTLGFPEPRVAMNSLPGSTAPAADISHNASMPLGASTSVGPNAGAPAILDSGSPTLTTRELIDLRNRSNLAPGGSALEGQPYPKSPTEKSVSASPVSYTSTVGAGGSVPTTPSPYQPLPKSNTPSVYQPLPADNTLSGRAYPPLPQDNPTLKVPQYEQGMTSAVSESQTIRQPTVNSSNRYPNTFAPQVPYTSIAPTQSGNTFGYPPGK